MADCCIISISAIKINVNTNNKAKSLKNQEEGWRDLNDILSHIDKYFNLRTTSTNTVKEVLKQNS